jgi:hypothetical protein
VKRKMKVETTIETHRILVIKRQENRVQARCTQCAEETMWVTPEEAMAVARMSTRTIYRRVEEGTIHCLELPAGMLLCLNSLRAHTTESIS